MNGCIRWCGGGKWVAGILSLPALGFMAIWLLLQGSVTLGTGRLNRSDGVLPILFVLAMALTPYATAGLVGWVVFKGLRKGVVPGWLLIVTLLNVLVYLWIRRFLSSP